MLGISVSKYIISVKMFQAWSWNEKYKKHTKWANYNCLNYYTGTILIMKLYLTVQYNKRTRRDRYLYSRCEGRVPGTGDWLGGWRPNIECQQHRLLWYTETGGEFIFWRACIAMFWVQYHNYDHLNPLLYTTLEKGWTFL